MKVLKFSTATIITFLISAALLSLNAKARDISSNHILSYSFDNAEGIIITDLSGKSNHGQLQGNATISDGYNNNGATLIDKADFVQLPENISEGLTSFTFTAWVNFNSLNASTRLLDLGNTATDNALVIIPSYKNNYGYISFRFQPYRGITYNVTSSQKIPVGSWTHIAVTYNWDLESEKGEASIYLNGKLVGTKNRIPHTPADFLGNTTNNYIGYSRDENDLTGFNGSIDDVKLYNIALTETEIKQISGLEGNDGDMLIRFDFSNSTENIVNDISKYGFKGSLENDAHIRTMGTSETGIYNVLDLGNSNGYFDMGESVGSAFTQMFNYTVSAYFRIDNTYTQLKNSGNYIWNFSNSDNITNDNNGYMAASLSSQSISISDKSPSEGQQSVALSKQALTGNWHHIAYTQNGPDGKLYIDGRLVKKGSITRLPQNTLALADRYGTLYNWLGRSCNPAHTNLKNTLLYDFRLYRKALTNDEIHSSVLDVERELLKLERAYNANLNESKTAETQVFERKINPQPQAMEVWSNISSTERINISQIEKISFANDEMKILKTGAEYAVPFANINNIRFSANPVSVKSQKAYQKINIYPNPSNGWLNIEFDNHETWSASLYSLSGQELINKNLNNADKHIDIRHLKKGVYLLKVNETIHKIVKN
ncbi:MAG: T9SS type A sorting domain-containing protein [Prolixibacteraceae bacterium]|jgi:hypothetical protein|nr:T9SS type A sorting domain-containing protein [Prolixibacteraceae bacterium]